MSNRLHILGLAAAFVLAGSAWVQAQSSPGQGGPAMSSPTGPTRGDVPGIPDSVPRDQQQMDPYSADKDFVKSVSETSATEVHLGKLAQDKGSTDAVKELGKRMVETHTQTGEQLKKAATALNVQISADPPRKAKKAEDKLAKLSGTDFDRAYAKIAADEQKQAVKQFEREAKNGKVPEVKDFAAKNLQAAEESQKQAEELAKGGTGTADRQK
jgi:putative membrane protein